MAFKLLITLIVINYIKVNLAATPASYLIPPPLQTSSQNSHLISPPKISPPSEPPGFMQRIARWFGFGANNVKDQQVQPSYKYAQYKEPPSVLIQNNQPSNHQYHRSKASCSPCNKVPWVPMFPGNLHYPLIKNHYNQPVPSQTHSLHPSQSGSENHHISLATYSPLKAPSDLSLQYAPAYNFQLPNLQRAPKFNHHHSPNNVISLDTLRGSPENIPNADTLPIPSNLNPIPIPNLSATPIPPLYDASIFNQNIQQVQHNEAEKEGVKEISPSYDDINNNVQIKFNSEPSIEIVQSVPVADFVSSVEYPANVVHSELIDVDKQSQQQFQTQLVHQSEINNVPKLIELGTYEDNSQSTHYQQSDYLQNPIVVNNHHEELDNYPEASSHNITFQYENKFDSSGFVNTPSEPFLPTIPSTSSERATHFQYSDRIEGPFSTSVKLSPNKTENIPINHLQPNSENSAHDETITRKRERETPKHLLDAPILYARESAPRPFRRDPNDFDIKNHNNGWHLSSTTQTPWALVPTPTSIYSSTDASGQWAGISPPAQYQPTSISYSSFLSPTGKRQKQIHQIIIPYTTKNKPQPFKIREERQQNDQPNDHLERYEHWSNSQDLEQPEQQESKYVTATETPATMPTKKTTKFFTKILASNIRELLRKEHEPTGKSRVSFDIAKLQKNINDWTQQEYTSSHKYSTLPHNGRSKMIPNEYFATTPSLKHFVTTITTPFSGISSSTEITTEIPTTTMGTLLSYDEFKKFEILDKYLNDNLNEISQPAESLQDLSTSLLQPTNMHLIPMGFTEAPTIPKSTTPETSTFSLPTRALTTASTTTKTTTEFASNELWKKLKISISPKTKEKVYVVTPQPFLPPSTTTTPDPVGSFKSPRFLVRPTPINGSNRILQNSPEINQPNSSGYTPELFGLMGISTFIPPDPVETLDGHSKVITVVTPASIKETETNVMKNDSSTVHR